MPDRNALFRAAERLHAHLSAHHLADGLLRGPDPGVRLNLRFWRFAKSALASLPWRDDYIFMQAQGYWILANWVLYESTAERGFRSLAERATEGVLRLQTAEGFWRYPLPERRHLVATVEGNWGAAGLLASFAREPRPEWLAGAQRWHHYLVKTIGFQQHSSGRAINYFDRPRGRIPNNSVEAAWLFLRLWKTSRDSSLLEDVDAMLEFVAAEQLPSGELPYIVNGPYEPGRDHYLCFQYNAFQFLKLAWSERLRPTATLRRILPGLARFLARGVRANGGAATNCFRVASGPEVDFYTAVLAAALSEADGLGLLNAREVADKCYGRVLERQRSDGSFAFSTGDYGFLGDKRSYPRQSAMILFHLLYGCGLGDGFGTAPDA
ncbi:MAG TPA: hypothetical protein VGZ29_07425 [Terriglobia bacterium]|nr:hypothetical protein [Terriglobia bacterium]